MLSDNKSDETTAQDKAVPQQVVDKSPSSVVNVDSTRPTTVVISSAPGQIMNQGLAVITDSNRSEICNEITPSEHGQMVDRSSEDPLNSDDIRSEMGSSNASSPRYVCKH